MKEYRKELSEQEREEKIKRATEAYSKFMDEILPGWQKDPNSHETPKRVAKMYVNELLNGYYGAEPKITSFPNIDKYTGMVFEGNIDIKSICSHHHAFFFGKAAIAYIPLEEGNIIGLSKLNRIADFYSRRVQVQENLCQQIHDAVDRVIGKNGGIAVFIRANHTCVSHRGVGQSSNMQTARLSGAFLDQSNKCRSEFYNFIKFSE